MNQAEYDRHVQTGLRNKEVSELVHNFCSHARVANRGGIGLIAQVTGLPLGMLGVECNHAPAGGMAGWYLEETAVDFYDRNCAHCDKRMALRMTNLLQLIDERDREVRKRRDAEVQAQASAAAAHQARKARRAALRVGQSAACCALLDDIDTLDEHPSDEGKFRVVETAKLAPEVFGEPMVDYFYELAASSEMSLHEQALLVLQQVAVDKTRLTDAALDCLGHGRAVDVAADIVMANPVSNDASKIEHAVPALISLARLPTSQFPSSERPRRPGPLKAAYKAWPDVVRRGVQRLLDANQSYPVRLGVAALLVLSEDDAGLLSSFARSTISKLARVHHLIEEDVTDRELRMVCDDLKRVVAATLLTAPESTDTLISDYFAGASFEGEERLSGVYEVLSRRSRRSRYFADDKVVLDETVNVVVLKRQLAFAGTSTNQKVLSNVVQSFRDEPDELVAAAGENLDALLGTAAVLDDRLEVLAAHRKEQPPTNFVEQLDAENMAQVLRQIRSSCLAIAATAAKGSAGLVGSYVDFLANVDERRDGLSSALTKAIPHLIDSPAALNVVLPHLYSSLVGASVLRRAAAAEALGELGKGRVADLPELVLEAFVLLLSDSYLYVHKAAARALPNVALPEPLERRAGRALENLIVHYSGKKDEHSYLVRFVSLYLRRFATAEQLRRGYRRAFIKFLMDVPAHLHIGDFRGMAKTLCAEPTYVDFVIHVFDDRELTEYGEEEACSLLYLIPEKAALQRASDLEKLVKRHPSRLMLAGSAIELLTRAGAWLEAAAAIEATWAAIPDTVPERPSKWARRLHVVAVQFEAAVAAGDASQQKALQAEWLKLEFDLQEDHQKYAKRRSALPSFLQPDSSD